MKIFKHIYYKIRSRIYLEIKYLLINLPIIKYIGIDCKILKLRYYACPKVGSSSMKSLFYKLNNIADLKRNHKLTEIKDIKGHKIYKNQDGFIVFGNADTFNHLIFVRDPIDRFVSGFNNRVLKRKEVFFANHWSLDKKIDCFIKNLFCYMRVYPSINWHFLPQVKFYSTALKNPNQLIKIKLEDANSFLISSIKNSSLQSDYVQELISDIQFKKNKTNYNDSTTKTKTKIISRSHLTDEHIYLLRKYYKKDFELFNSI